MKYLFFAWRVNKMVTFAVVRLKKYFVVSGLQLRDGVNGEESRMPVDGVTCPGSESSSRLQRQFHHQIIHHGTSSTNCDDDQDYARMEAWLDEHPNFVQDYFLRWAVLE